MKPALSILLTLLAQHALAHRLFWNPDSMTLEQAYPIDNSIFSVFIIGNLSPYQADYFHLTQVANQPVILALLAPQACPDFLPELWIIAKTLPETQEAPFEVPPDYKAIKVENPWRIYQDYIISARLGPNVRLRLDEQSFYAVVYANHASGSYIAYKVGRDTIGGSVEGFDALARFVRCQILEVE
jgi:hypothetical protein